MHGSCIEKCKFQTFNFIFVLKNKKMDANINLTVIKIPVIVRGHNNEPQPDTVHATRHKTKRSQVAADRSMAMAHFMIDGPPSTP